MLSRLAALVSLAVLAGCASHRPSYDWQGETPSAPAQTAHHADRTLSLRIGESQIEEFEESQTDDQLLVGLDFAYVPPLSNMGVEVGLAFSGNSEDDVDNPGQGNATIDEVSHGIGELYAGLRFQSQRRRTIQPYLGVGAALVSVSETSEDAGDEEDDDDTTIGAYAHAGIQFALDPIMMGFDVRILRFTDVDLTTAVARERVRDVDSEQFTMFVGWSF
jgi:opacity protein-like surface antigen